MKYHSNQINLASSHPEDQTHALFLKDLHTLRLRLLENNYYNNNHLKALIKHQEVQKD